MLLTELLDLTEEMFLLEMKERVVLPGDLRTSGDWRAPQAPQ